MAKNYPEDFGRRWEPVIYIDGKPVRYSKLKKARKAKGLRGAMLRARMVLARFGPRKSFEPCIHCRAYIEGLMAEITQAVTDLEKEIKREGLDKNECAD